MQTSKEKADTFIPAWQDSIVTELRYLSRKGRMKVDLFSNSFENWGHHSLLAEEWGEQIRGRKMGWNYRILAQKGGKWKIIGHDFLFGLDQPMLSWVKNNKYSICNIIKSPLKKSSSSKFLEDEKQITPGLHWESFKPSTCQIFWEWFTTLFSK